MIKDKKAAVFYFLMSLILLDFGNQLRIISYHFIPYNNPVFSIEYVRNTGSAFGLFQNQALILAIFGIIVLIFLIYYVITSLTFKDKLLLLSSALFSAGALGNAVERLKFGFVADYIKLNFIDFPVFNAFDVMICLSCFLYVIFIIFFQKDKK